MTVKLFAAALMASTLLAAPALAQSNPPLPSKQPTAAAPATAPTMQKADQWRASKLVGLDVYNASNEKIGDIKELITDSNGRIDLLVIGVGGFLGMGEHNVGLAFNQVKFVNEPAGKTTGSGTASTKGTREYPDHVVVNMSKDQLKGLPAFKYASDAK
jgi:sporulation protein YlmC with PRC-barrel domain